MLFRSVLVSLSAQAAALAAVANKFPNASLHQSQSSNSQLGRDIDERDRQSSITMRGDIDERPSDVCNRATTSNLGLLQAATNVHSATSSSSSPTALSMNDEQLKAKAIQDILRTARPPSSDILSSSTTNNSSAGPSFDFISMLAQLKQPRQAQSG